MPRRPLGSTGLETSVLALGTVKFGRRLGLKYTAPPELPTDHELHALLDMAQELGITTLDTAPAYGVSEQRLGSLLADRGDRDRWLVCTKAGEHFDETDGPDGSSSFDFSPAGIRASVERSIVRLRTDVVDVVLLHSSGEDELALFEEPLDTLRAMQRAGHVRAVGASTKSPEGGRRCVERCDVAMLTINVEAHADGPACAGAARAGVGVLAKKPLASGSTGDPAASLRFVLAQPGVSAAVVGTTSPDHLRANAEAAIEACGATDSFTPPPRSR